MTAKIIHIQPASASVPDALRNIADQYEAGDYADDPVTIVIGREGFHIGTRGDDNMAVNAVFDLQLGIHKLMAAATWAALE